MTAFSTPGPVARSGGRSNQLGETFAGPVPVHLVGETRTIRGERVMDTPPPSAMRAELVEAPFDRLRAQHASTT